mgnify:FL=1
MTTTLQLIFGFLSGFGLFLYGIYLMGETLQEMAGEQLKKWLERYTDTPYKGLLVGTILTAVIHSSSGTTALTISLVRANLMSFASSIGIILGANIGTTFTAFLTGLHLSPFAPIFISVCALIIFVSANENIKNIAKVLFGFGLIFFGMDLIDQSLSHISDSVRFKSLLFSFTDRPYLSLFIGTILTAIIQSSTLAIGILQTVYASGLIDLRSALPLIFGSNIGTTISLEIFAVSGSVEAKRTALFQILYNVFGALFFMILIGPFEHLLKWMISILHLSPKLSIAMAHILFNILSAVIVIGFTKEIETLIKRLVKR